MFLSYNTDISSCYITQNMIIKEAEPSNWQKKRGNMSRNITEIGLKVFAVAFCTVESKSLYTYRIK